MDVVHLISPRIPTPVQGISNGGVKEGALRKTAWKRERVHSTTGCSSQHVQVLTETCTPHIRQPWYYASLLSNSLLGRQAK